MIVGEKVVVEVVMVLVKENSGKVIVFLVFVLLYCLLMKFVVE